MKSIITTLLVITFSIISAISQDLSGVWHGNAKTPDDKEILFVFLFEKNGDAYTTTMAVPIFDVSGIKPKTTTFKNGILSIDGSNAGFKYEGTFNETTQQIEGSYTERGTVLSLVYNKRESKNGNSQ